MVPSSSLLLAICLLAFSTGLNAQSVTERRTPRPPVERTDAAPPEEVDDVTAQRRVVAISLLTSLADEARGFRDQKFRARVQARAADVLWDSEEERARALFYRAWEDAEAADAESERVRAEDIRRQLRTTGVVAMAGRRDIRSEVLRMAAKRDRGLGEELLKKLEETIERELAEKKEDLARDQIRDLGSAPAAAAKRLELARRLLEDGDIARAMEFAGPALHQVNRDSINFLSALREKNPQAADQAFVALLAQATRDPSSDANTVSGLSSYALTPFLYVTYSRDGGASSSRERPSTAAPDLSSAVLTTFFRVAAEILLRSLLPPDQDQTSSGRAGKYLVIQRLLPFFEQFAPERTPELRTHMTALSGDIPERLRGAEDRTMPRAYLDQESTTDPIERMQERLDRASSSQEKDGIYADVAVALARKGDSRTKDIVDKIEDSELRKQVRAYTDFQLARIAIRDRNADEATRIARSGELTSIQRVWVFTQTARQLMNSDRPRAVDLLTEAAVEARRIGGNDADRARSLTAVANGFLEADRVRAWETISEAVKAANSTDGFTGEDSMISVRLQTRQMVMVENTSGEDFDLTGAFKSFANDDFFRSIDLAKSLKGETPRAVATLAIARSAFE
ncbi:MAG TPA: hypothetical protein VMM84_14725 [Pyrinomonadaceae bacterium]|nr:hypothetical protein [Pyrinomonadaceae bacterium]